MTKPKPPSLFRDLSDVPPRRIHANVYEDGSQGVRVTSTPSEDRQGIEVLVLPRKVIPVIFLPGVMGTHLRLTPERQQELRKKNDIAWRPEATAEAISMMSKSAAQRQRILDPEATSVDRYDPKADAEANKRHRNVKKVLFVSGPDNIEAEVTERARLRGWSEVYFDSYGKLLKTLESSLNTICYLGELWQGWTQGPTAAMAIPTSQWGGDGGAALTEDELRTISDAWYPVHAVGYNWLKSNADSAKYVAERIKEIKAGYQKMKFDCRKVIVVTHSMGGLVARALIHPSYGNAQSEVAGIVHGVMPAIGAGAAYKRMRMGFEGGYLERKVLGDTGPKVTAILANAPAGLQLLPTERYAPRWLRAEIDGQTALSLPQSDPYSEIYTVQDKWYRLINPEWVNPARQETSTLERTTKLLFDAQKFHNSIASTYHDETYLSYGADDKHRAWGTVTWKAGTPVFHSDQGVQAMRPSSVDIMPGAKQWQCRADQGEKSIALYHEAGNYKVVFNASIADPADAGDGTVPAECSARDPIRQGKPKVGFTQTGYDHQSSYQNDKVIASTLYGIARIAHDAFDWWDED